MIYFFHHYELPVILQQARIQQIIIENQQHPDPNAPNISDRTDGQGGNENEVSNLNEENSTSNANSTPSTTNSTRNGESNETSLVNDSNIN